MSFQALNELPELLPYLTPLERGELDRLLATPLAQFKNNDAVTWIEKHFIIPETGQPLHLERYQRRALREALRRDPDGYFVYSTIIWSDVKKSAKSTIAAAVALWRAFQVDWGQVVIVANDLKQADSRVGYYMRRAIELNPAMKEVCKIIQYKISLPNKTFIESIPIDPSGEAGGNADMVVFSELWGAHEQAKDRMFTEMTLPPGKMGRSFRWIETYAGFSGESLLLERLHEQGVKNGHKLDSQLADVYINEAARMFCMWNTKGLMPWHTPEYYAEQAAVLLPNEFRRVHGNEWVTSEDVFVNVEWWDACHAEYPAAKADEPWVVAMDAGVSSDNFAMVAVARHPTDPSRVVKRYARRWIPPKGGKIDFQGTDDQPGPELELRRLIANRNIIEVTYDPMQLEDMANRLKKEGLAWFRPFTQAKERLIADNMLRQMIMDRRILHDGDGALREHIQNANAEIDGEERKIRIVKRSELLKIDLAVALSMANAECMRLNL